MQYRDIWLNLASNLLIGSHTLHKLRAGFNDPNEIIAADDDQLHTLELDDKIINLIRAQLTVDVTKVKTILDRHAIAFVWFDDEEFPELLRNIPDSPACLFVRGQPLSANDISIAVVGSRKATPYGRQMATEIVGGLAASGITAVSGLAFGIDAIAHQAALDVGGKTVAVLANGLDDVFPTSHRALANEIVAKGGTIVSEFPPGTPALKHHFPIRNRIIAGLSRGTFVVEAAQESGSLITARLAIEAGRDVFALPGPVTSPVSAGPHGLIKMGAKLVTSANDIIEELGLVDISGESAAKAIIPDSASEAALLEHLTRDPIQLDDLIRTSGLEAATVTSTLLLMEMKGKARNLGANQFVIGH